MTERWRVWVEIEREGTTEATGREEYRTEAQQCVGLFDNEADAQALASELQSHAGISECGPFFTRGKA